MTNLKAFTNASQIDLNSLDVEEQLALLNYYGNLGPLYKRIGKKSSIPNFTEDIVKPCIKRIEFYQDSSFDNFVLCKDFHKAYLSEILLGLGEELAEFEIDKLKIPSFSDDEFWTILRDFFNSIKEQDIFEELYKEKRIHFKGIKSKEEKEGAILYNPFTKDTDIFIRIKKKNLITLLSLVHEIGHAVDFRRFKGDIKSYNEFFYGSFNLEVISQLFEKAFIRFLSKRNLLKGREDFFINELLLNYDILLAAFICSLLNKEDFKEGYINLSDKELAKKLGHFFSDKDVFLASLSNVGSRDINKIYNYAYGDVLSTFLLDPFCEEGFDSDNVNKFMKHRAKLFDENFLRECGFGPKKHLELYKKDLELIKK